MTNPPITALVFTDTARCDGPWSHDVRLITDGRMAHAYEVTSGMDTDLVSRKRTAVTVFCPCCTAAGDTGYATFHLDTPGWFADTEAHDLLTRYGVKVEVD